MTRTSQPMRSLGRKSGRSAMSLLKGSKFALRDSSNFGKLTSRLIKYNDGLRKICSANDYDVSAMANCSPWIARLIYLSGFWV